MHSDSSAQRQQQNPSSGFQATEMVTGGWFCPAQPCHRSCGVEKCHPCTAPIPIVRLQTPLASSAQLRGSTGAQGCTSRGGKGAVCHVLHPKVLCVMLHPKPRLDVFQVLSPQQLWDASAHPSHCLSEIQDAPVPLPPDLWMCWACSGFQQTQHSGHKSEPLRYRDLLSASPCVKVSGNGFSCSCQETKIHISEAI